MAGLWAAEALGGEGLWEARGYGWRGFRAGAPGGRGAPGSCLAKAKANFFPYDIDFPQDAATYRFFNDKTFVDALFEKKDEEKKGSPSEGKSKILESFDTPINPIPSFEYK
ncbi:hypothetical protein GUJ93_ZPchr0015g6851 [Zizania palustris]|uniref:Uncharacterized protein n=1 Tax=Zizania palustris TaxID=103762 RepID=A0A8J5THH5_ZIZPA|nr:hypothetical protein GUJ93_ZPchr0015g6851 [Zizania palustris]